MLSKIKPWDFSSRHNNLSAFLSRGGVKGFFIDDPFVENIVKEKLPKKDLDLRIFTGSEINKNFLDEQFLNLSLFSSPQNILVINAETMGAETTDYLFKEIEKNIESQLILFFSKTSKANTEFAKNSSGEFFEIEGVKPWEGQKLLQFYIKELAISIPNDIQRYLLENLENNSENFYQALKLIELNFQNSSIPMGELKELIARDRFDFFELLDLYHHDRRKLLVTISRKTEDHDWFRQFSSSIQGHLLKVLYPSEIQSKDRPTKYEQNVLIYAEKESRLKLKNDLAWFSKLEIMAKSRDEFLKDQIRQEILKA